MRLPQKKIYSLEEAREKIRRYCAYQERSQKQAREKLKSYGLIPSVVDELFVELIQDNFLNEQRFADAFVQGKFNQKGWGKRKIEVELKKHGVSRHCAEIALSNVEKDEYSLKLLKVAEKKWRSLLHEPKRVRKQKAIRFLLGRGFFYEEIKEALVRIERND